MSCSQAQHQLWRHCTPNSTPPHSHGVRPIGDTHTCVECCNSNKSPLWDCRITVSTRTSGVRNRGSTPRCPLYPVLPPPPWAAWCNGKHPPLSLVRRGFDSPCGHTFLLPLVTRACVCTDGASRCECTQPLGLVLISPCDPRSRRRLCLGVQDRGSCMSFAQMHAGCVAVHVIDEGLECLAIEGALHMTDTNLDVCDISGHQYLLRGQ